MPDTFITRLKKAINVFRSVEDEYTNTVEVGIGSGYRPDRLRLNYGTEQSIVSPLFTRIGIDVAAVEMRHAKVDENGRYLETIKSGINNCLTLEANLDQDNRSFIQDAAMSLCDEGVIAIVPVDTTLDPKVSSSYDVLTMRTAAIRQWYPEHVQVNLYNDQTGLFQDITLEKTRVAIVENPLYAVMNESSSTLKRLIDKLNLLDVIDRQSGSGKLDLIIQLPFAIKSTKKQEMADKRLASIESQLQDSPYGIAYIDATEKVTQLNRPAENNLMGQIEYLTSMLFSQLGLTTAIFDGTASEEELLNYYNRTIEPIVAAITKNIERKFLTKTGRTQGQTIMAFRDPFRLTPPGKLPDMADKFTRNEIMSSNEFRAVLAMKPSNDPRADELRNKNLNEKVEEPDKKEAEPQEEESEN